ncbi:bifunctional protein pyrR [Mycobacterium xenopi 4042]|uniref:Bifunctional protein pyrR n=1 Tax=Mycobacterium xenopi 4042 TaxID=1299334 RepID=X8C096_MYCXE|nr:bifunctional protein pyrR [Mycobacterium xenopi 4042]
MMSAADVGRTISRIAHQIIEKTALDAPEARAWCCWHPTRGVILAERLAATSASSPVSTSITARSTSPCTATT